MNTYTFNSTHFVQSFTPAQGVAINEKYYPLLSQLFPGHNFFMLLLNDAGELFVDMSSAQYRFNHPDTLLHLLTNGSDILFTNNMQQKPYNTLFYYTGKNTAKFFVCAALKSQNRRLLGCFGVIGEQQKTLLPDEQAFIQWLAENIAQDLSTEHVKVDDPLLNTALTLPAAIVPYLDDIYTMTDREGVIISIAEQLPVHLKEFIGCQGGTLTTIFGEQHNGFFTDLIGLAAATQKKQKNILQLPYNNTELMFSVSCNSFSGGWYLITFHDMTERNRMREILEARKQLLEGIVQAGNVGVLLLSADGGIIYSNENAVNWLDIDSSSAQNRLSSAHWCYANIDPLKASPLQQVFIKKQNLKDERYQFLSVQCGHRTFSINATYICAEPGKLPQATIFIHDVSERALLDQAMEDMEEKMQFLLQASPVVIYQMLPKPFFQFTYISPNVSTILGQESLAFMNKTIDWQALIHPDDIDEVVESFSMVHDCNVEYRLWIAQKNEYRWFKDIRRFIEGDYHAGWIGALLDINERKEAERAQYLIELRNQELQHELSSTLDSLVDAVININQQGKIINLNPAACTLFGYTKEQMYGKNVSMLMPEGISQHHDRYIQNYMRTGDAKIIGVGREVNALHADGHEFPIALSLSVIGQGDNRSFVGCCHDLTLLKKQQEQLLHTEKLSAVGKLTSSLAHDFNNILGIVRGYAEMLLQETEQVAQLAQPIVDASDRASAMISQLLDFSSSKKRVLTHIKINQHLKSLSPMLEKTLHKNIQLTIETATQEVDIAVEQPAFDNALINMAVNANHAMHGMQSTLIIKTALCAHHELPEELEAKTGDFISIAIQDFGCGMSHSTQQKIFEPFFTTKGHDGTGLGLAQAYGMVQRCNGKISVASSLGKGTCFTLYFPYVKSALAAAKKQRSSVLPDEAFNMANTQKAQGKTILLVDDEQELLHMNAMLLESAGFKVIKTDSPTKAILLAKNHAFDLLLSDIVMPQMNGFELAQTLKADYPYIQVQLLSGFASESMIVNEQCNDWYEKRLVKPVSLTVLLKRVNELINL